MKNSPGERPAPAQRPELRAVETPPLDEAAAPESARAGERRPATAAEDAAREARIARRRAMAARAAALAEAQARVQPAPTQRSAVKLAGGVAGTAAVTGTAAAPAPRPVPGPAPAPKPATAPASVTAPAPATAPETRPARMQTRHRIMALSFVLLVLAPFAAATAYLYLRAADQYHSEVAFSIRSEETNAAAAGLLGALTSIGTGSASDADILFEYVRSQAIVEEIDADLGLRGVYNRAQRDPVFTLGDDASIEDLVRQWKRMVDVAFESSTGIIHVRANAFAPEDATAVSAGILAHSSALVNELSEQAREDAVRFAREELAEAEETLRVMRQRLSDFRRANRIVDPSGDVAGQSGLLNALEAELAQGLVERDMLLSFVGNEDQRVIQANRRIDAVTGRIEAERASLGASGTGGALPDVVGRYEELLVDLEFANASYTQALAGLAAARAEARRQSRYLAPHIRPTAAERALYPRRGLLAGLTGLFLLLGWGTLMLVYYNMRDNR